MARSSASRSRGRRSRSGGARRTARRSRSRERAERARQRSRSRGTRGTSGERRQAKQGATSRSRERRRHRSRSQSERAKQQQQQQPARRTSRSRRRSRSRGRRYSRSKSHSRRARRRSRSPEERIPPVDFSDYEPSPDGGGWYVYKKTGKWKYHPETGLYLHVKSKVYYVQKEGDPKTFRKIEDDEDPVVKKMKQSEEMRKAIQSTEFVKFDESGNPAVQDCKNCAQKCACGMAIPQARPKSLLRSIHIHDL